MNKTEKIISAVTAIALGILLIVLKNGVLHLLNAVVGIVLLALGVLDLVKKDVKMGVIKCVAGALILACGWLVLQVILYVFAALLIIVGVCWIYDLIRCGVKFTCDFKTILEFVKPALCLFIGILLFFNQGGAVDWIFIVCGITTTVEGVLLLFTTLANE